MRHTSLDRPLQDFPESHGYPGNDDTVNGGRGIEKYLVRCGKNPFLDNQCHYSWNCYGKDLQLNGC